MDVVVIVVVVVVLYTQKFSQLILGVG